MKPTNLHCTRFQKQLARMKVDGYWVTHIPDLFYLSGYGAEGCWGLFGKRECALLVPMLAVDQAAALAKGFEIIQLKKMSEVYGLIVDYAVKAGWKTAGYDPYHTPEAYILGLRKASGNKLKWVAGPGATTPLRVKKDQKELKALRGAGHAVA